MLSTDPFNTPDFTFDAASHVYKWRGIQLESGTTFIKQFIEPFDQDYWAEKKSTELGITKEEMIKQWKDKSTKAMAIGTSVHRMIEEFLLGLEVRISENPLAVKKYVRWLEWWTRVIHSNYEVEAIEWRMFSTTATKAGTADLLCSRNDEFIMLDWKTNAEFKLNGFNFLKAPFDQYDDSDLNKYSLQLSLYRAMAMRAGIDIPAGYIVHIGEEEVHKYQCRDFREEFIRMLK